MRIGKPRLKLQIHPKRGSINPENERLVQQAFNALTANKTLIVIAHRLNTVQYADKIIVLELARWCRKVHTAN
jgi:ABC-type transport system involved in Fe-S cluster assembly fused permease/ATPase subunit